MLTGVLLLVAVGCGQGQELGGALIGPTGGQVHSADGRARLDFPPGALDAPTRISIDPIDDLPGTAPGTSYELSPSGLVFGASPLLVLSYAGVAWSSTEAAARPTVIKVREDGEIIAQLTEHDAATETATAALVGFSAYGIASGTPPLPSSVQLEAEHDAGVTSLSWTLSTPRRGALIVIERAGPLGEPPRESDWATVDALPFGRPGYIDPGPLVPESIYWYRVRVRQGAVLGRASTIFVGTFADRAPRSLDLSAALDGDAVNLRWDPLAIAHVDHFELRVEVDGVPRRHVVTLPNTQSAVRLGGISDGHRYRFVLSAVHHGIVQASATTALIHEGFYLESTPGVVEVVAGDVATAALTEYRSPSFTAPIAYSWSLIGANPGFTVTFSPSRPAMTQATVAVAATVPPGRYYLDFHADAAGQRGGAHLIVVVAPLGDFTFALLPRELLVHSGDTPGYRFEVIRSPDYSAPITWAFVGLPEFLSRSGAPSESGGYFLVGPGTPGSYPFIVRGTSGGGDVVERTMTVELR